MLPKKKASKHKTPEPGSRLSRGKHRLMVDATKVCLGRLLLPGVADLRILIKADSQICRGRLASSLI